MWRRANKSLVPSICFRGFTIRSRKKAGIKASHSVVGRILKNARYLGDAFYPAIIDAETFKAAESERIRRAEKEYETKNLKSKKRPPFLRPSALRKARRNTATHLCRQNMHTA